MSGKYILGSGLVGMIAMEILGDGWEAIPHGRSRYYSFDPALADNYIVKMPSVSDVLSGHQTRPYRRAFSLKGALIWTELPWLTTAWSEKVHGTEHPYIKKVLKTEFDVISLRANDLYQWLLSRHIDKVKQNNARFGTVTKIAAREITTSTGLVLPYDRILSTIPLNALLEAVGASIDGLEARDVWVYHIQTDALDFEGADELLVVEPEIDFYKVAKIGKFDYLFFCLKEIFTPESYFGLFMDRFTVVAGGRTKVAKAIPMSPPPDLGWLDQMGIRCLGSNAEWDDMIDVSTCVYRLLKMRSP